MTLLVDMDMPQINFQLSSEQTADLLKTLKALNFYTPPKWSSTSDHVTPKQWVSTLSAERMSRSTVPHTSVANRERVQMWYDELMRGGHQQAFSTLVDKSGAVCAMGAAWQVYARETGASALPPKEGNAYRLMKEWYGYEDEDPQLTGILPMGASVTKLNDLYRWSLEQIAEAVRLTFLAGEPETAELDVAVPDSPAELAEQELVNA